MRAMVYHGNRDLRLETVPEPRPAPGEVKLRVDLCGICATDIEEFQYGPVFISHDTPHPLTGKTMPIITGHELTGTVAEVGDGVDHLGPGERVALIGVVSCTRCWWCRNQREHQCPSAAYVGFSRDGGLAEYVTWPASHTVPLPERVSSRDAALVEPTSVAYHAVHRAPPEPGQHVAVLGTGTIGLLALQVARTSGARVYAIDRRQVSLDLALRMGADAAINSDTSNVQEALGEHTGGVGPDVVIDAAGGPGTPEQAVTLARVGGTAVLVAIYTAKPAFDFNTVVARETRVLGSLGYSKSDVRNAVALISAGKVQTAPLVSDVIGLDQVIDVGFARMMQGEKDFFRILVDPSR